MAVPCFSKRARVSRRDGKEDPFRSNSFFVLLLPLFPGAPALSVVKHVVSQESSDQGPEIVSVLERAALFDSKFEKFYSCLMWYSSYS